MFREIKGIINQANNNNPVQLLTRIFQSVLIPNENSDSDDDDQKSQEHRIKPKHQAKELQSMRNTLMELMNQNKQLQKQQLKEKQNRQRQMDQMQAKFQKQIQEFMVRQKDPQELQKLQKEKQLELEKLRQLNQVLKDVILYIQVKKKKMQQQLIQLEKQSLELLNRAPEIIFKPDPKEEAQLEQMKKKNKEQLIELKKLNNPQKMKEAKESQLVQFLEYLSRKDFSNELEGMDNGTKQNMLIGEISSGKSSTLNYLFNKYLQTGIDQTTMQPCAAHELQGVLIWDTPGLNQHFDLKNLRTLKFLAIANRVFILFQKSLKCSKDQVRIIATIKKGKNVYCVRTMCDKFKEKGDLDNALKDDRKILTEWGFGEIPVLATSNKVGLDVLDNKKLKQLLES